MLDMTEVEGWEKEEENRVDKVAEQELGKH